METKTMTTTHENLNEAPKKQWASSIAQQLVGSLPASIALAIGATWICYAALPDAAAVGLAVQIQAACLVGGAASTIFAGAALPRRSEKLTDAKIALQAPALLPDVVSAGGDVKVGANSNPVEPKAGEIHGIGIESTPVFVDSIPRGEVIDSQ